MNSVILALFQTPRSGNTVFTSGDAEDEIWFSLESRHFHFLLQRLKTYSYKIPVESSPTINFQFSYLAVFYVSLWPCLTRKYTDYIYKSENALSKSYLPWRATLQICLCIIYEEYILRILIVSERGPHTLIEILSQNFPFSFRPRAMVNDSGFTSHRFHIIHTILSHSKDSVQYRYPCRFRSCARWLATIY